MKPETGKYFKNGASSKSQTDKGNLDDDQNRKDLTGRLKATPEQKKMIDDLFKTLSMNYFYLIFAKKNR
ncbi:MAG: hypothetical protein LBD80_00895 [Tannerella sp.]|nr:hypothetical protein [Tannerella sp.]